MPVEEKSIDSSMGMIPDEELDAALRDFGVEEDWIVLPFMSVDNEVIASNRRSETARKALIQHQGENYILKEFPWYCADEDFINFTLSLQNELRDYGSPIPEFKATDDGRKWTQHGDEYLFMQEFVPGDSWEKTENKVQSAGSTLAELHEGSQEVQGSVVNGQQFVENVFELADGMVDIVEEDLLREHHDELDSGDINQLEYFVSRANEALERNEPEARSKGYEDHRIPVHGDYNPLNLIFAENNDVKAIIDFDNSAIDNPAHDVAEGLLDISFMEYRGKTTRFEGVPEQMDSDLAETFLEGYSDSSYSDEVEEYLPEVATAVYLELASLGIVRGDYEFSEAENLARQEETVYEETSSLLSGRD